MINAVCNCYLELSAFKGPVIKASKHGTRSVNLSRVEAIRRGPPRFDWWGYAASGRKLDAALIRSSDFTNSNASKDPQKEHGRGPSDDVPRNNK
jgi:hypothetical protein